MTSSITIQNAANKSNQRNHKHSRWLKTKRLKRANMTSGTGCCKSGLNVLLHYETVKIIDIKNKKVGALYRFIQLLIVAYVIG